MVLRRLVRYGLSLIAVAAALSQITAHAQLQFETVKALAVDGSEGGSPRGPMAQMAGSIYGFTTTPNGMQLFRFDPADGAYEVVWDAAVLPTGFHNVGDGGLVLAGDGNLYFVDEGKHPDSPCPSASGWVGRVTPPGTVTHVATFCTGVGQPINPFVGLVVGFDGALYGVAGLSTGGAAIYRVGMDGAISKVADFLGVAGTPNALTAGTDDWLYGTTTSATGQVYRVHPVLGTEVLHVFAGSDGSRPRGRLLEVAPGPGQDIAFVGVTERGGLYGRGVVYRVDVASGVATVTTLHEFTGGAGGLPDDGNTPMAGLMQARGQLYGTTGGGPSGRVYRIGAAGGFSVVYELGVTPSAGGVVSDAPLLLGLDGHLYGTTSLNSAGPPPAPAAGSVFRLRFASAQPDLRQTNVSNPPTFAVPGSKFSVTDTVENSGFVIAAKSTTRYYFSLDGVKGSGDILLKGPRAVPQLAVGAASTGSKTVTIPATTPEGSYRMLACADDTTKLSEVDEANNCLVSATTVLIGWPDLLTTAISNPPAGAIPGGKFNMTDTVLNQGTVPADKSKTQYYLSLDEVKGAGDVLLTGRRSVPVLAVGSSSSGSKTVTVPLATPLGTYYVLACADDLAQIGESDNANNCRTSAGTVSIHP